MLQKIERALTGCQCGVEIRRTPEGLGIYGSLEYSSLCLAPVGEPVNEEFVVFDGEIPDARLRFASFTAIHAVRQAGLQIARGAHSGRLYVVLPAQGQEPEVVFDLKLRRPEITLREATSWWPDYSPE
ncbi:hypothetical protein KBB60_00605 [Patescibacteria group bacterium]|nr:hypothetical protein [Patescibacteria group bacterium]